MGRIRFENNSTANYSNIKFEDGTSILIGVATTGVKINRLRLFGSIPTKILFRISTEELFSEDYEPFMRILNGSSTAISFLEVFRDFLITCTSLEEVERKLETIAIKRVSA
jgi:hypothetical protein